MPRKLIVILLLITSGVVCRAQKMGTVKGNVSDSTGKGLDLVTILIEENQNYVTSTDKKGFFELKVPANQNLTLLFYSMTTRIVRRPILVKPNETISISQVLTVKLNQLDSVVINPGRKTDNGVGNIDVKNTPFLVSPNGSFENTLRYQALGVQQNNELSSSYSVRGGNYDENLVYVNDFEINRPYLIRSGQQEGLSFINPDMAGDVKFSSGGFQSKYGDKMSSVLDVTYRRPDSLHGSGYASLLGWGAHLEGSDKKRRFTFSIGGRQRNSQYVLKSLDTQGEYSPNFIDVQAYLTYQVSPKVELDFITNYSRNKYTFIPVDRQTDFGLLTDVLRLTVYYNGDEADQYQNMMNGLSLTYKINPDLRLKFLTAYYLDREQENYDILGQYFLSQVQNDIGQSNFGQILYNLGVGGEEDWARNTFNSDIIYGGFRGSWFKKKHNLQWGLDYKHEIVETQLSQWTNLDSAGYSLPFNYTTNYNQPQIIGGNLYYNNTSPQIQLLDVLKSGYSFQANRISGFIQDSWKFGDSAKFSFNYGLRFQYYDLNREAIVTPRVQLSYRPKGVKDIILTLAGGLYYQPPFYREMLNGFTGTVNTNLRSQKSAQVVAGLNYAFMAWNRHFTFTTEAYYKYLWALDPYVYNDVLIDYLGTNSARGYSGGVDMRLNGELAEGAESWITLSIMNTEQIISGAQYVVYYDSSGNQVANNEQTAGTIARRDTIHPRYLPRPTDQRVSVSIFFQDYLPKFKFIKVHIGVVLATGLPFGPPGTNFFQDVLRTPPYRRVDIGFSGQLWNPHWAKKKNAFNQGLRGVWLSLEVFNLFGISNVASYTWIRDIYNNQYAVPNYLSSRRVNAKLLFTF